MSAPARLPRPWFQASGTALRPPQAPPSPRRQPGPPPLPPALAALRHGGRVPPTPRAFARRRGPVARVHSAAGSRRSEGSDAGWPVRAPAPRLPRCGPFPLPSAPLLSQPPSGVTVRGTSGPFEDPAGTRACGSPSPGQSRCRLQLQSSPLISGEAPRAPQGTPGTPVSARPCTCRVLPVLIH